MGGAGMVDLSIKDLSLKLNWLTRLAKFDGCWKDYITQYIKCPDIEYFLSGNLQFKDLPVKCNIHSIWNDVFHYWCKYNYRTAEFVNNSGNVGNSNIWYNSNIKIANKTVFWKHWYDNNIRYIIDLFNISKARFYSWLEFKAKYGITCKFLQFTSLISAIPRQWKRTLINKYLNDQDEIGMHANSTLSEVLLSSVKPSSDIYKRYVDDANDQPCDRYDKWSKDINMEFFDTDLDWYEHLYDWYSCTKSVEIRSFIYNFNMRNIVTRKYLHKVKIIDASNCLKCNKEEDLLHLFWSCDSTNKLWFDLNDWLTSILGITLETSCESVLMNILTTDVTYLNLLTFVYTICKKVIYNNRESSKPVNLIHVINVLKKYEKIERLNAMGLRRLQNHFNKWLELFITWSTQDNQ